MNTKTEYIVYNKDKKAQGIYNSQTHKMILVDKNNDSTTIFKLMQYDQAFQFLWLNNQYLKKEFSEHPTYNMLISFIGKPHNNSFKQHQLDKFANGFIKWVIEGDFKDIEENHKQHLERLQISFKEVYPNSSDVTYIDENNNEAAITITDNAKNLFQFGFSKPYNINKEKEKHINLLNKDLYKLKIFLSNKDNIKLVLLTIITICLIKIAF